MMGTVHKPRKQSHSSTFKEAIILQRYEALYFQIPKVACTSLKQIFANLLGFSENDAAFIHLVDFPAIGKEECIREAYKHYYRFAFVRNPWDRLWSCYCSKIATRKTKTGYRFKNGVHRSFSKYKNIKSGMSFDAFVRVVQEIPDEQSDLHFKSQHTFITNQNGELLVDFIGTFESLQDDFRTVCNKIGIPEQTLPHENKRYPKHCDMEFTEHYSRYYSEESKRIVSERYRKDIELLGYRFEDK